VRRVIADMNPTLRGFLIVAFVALVIFALSLETTLLSLFVIARIAFFLAIAFFLYLVWRERRSDIAVWPARARAVFYGGAALIVADLAAYFTVGASGLDALAFLLVIILCGFAMFRTWRDQERV
jgi:small-conductance mechanosensitive channel